MFTIFQLVVNNHIIDLLLSLQLQHSCSHVSELYFVTTNFHAIISAFRDSFFDVSAQNNAMQLLSASLTTHNCFIKKTSTELRNEKYIHKATERHAKKKRVRGSEQRFDLYFC